MRLAATVVYPNGTLLGERVSEGKLCDFGYSWWQNQQKTCEPKPGWVYLFEPQIGFLPLWMMPKCNITVRAQVWTERGDKATDFQGSIYVEGDKKLIGLN